VEKLQSKPWQRVSPVEKLQSKPWQRVSPVEKHGPVGHRSPVGKQVVAKSE